MASLDLGTLKVGVKVDGAEKAKADLKGVETATKSIDKNSEKSSKGIKTLSGTFKEASGSGKGLSGSLGSLVSSFGGGTSASGLLAGAIGGLATGFVMLAKEAIQQAIAALINFGKQGIETASNVKEVQNVVDTTFGEGASKIEEFTDRAGTAFGLSELQASKYSSTLGAMFKSMGLGTEQVELMSVNMAQLTGDMASFYNLDHDAAFDKIRAGISGETEPLKQLGINLSVVNLEAYAMSQGMDKAYSSMTEVEKTTLRYNYILNATKDAQGDFNKTSEEYANVSRNLENSVTSASAAFGEGLLPSLADAKSGMMSWINSSKDVIGLVGSLIGTLIQSVVSLAKILEPPFRVVLAIINEVAKWIKYLVDMFNDAVNAVGNFINELFLGTDTAEDVKYSMVDMASTTKDAMGSAAKEVEDSFANMSDSAKSELDTIKSALDNYYDKERRERLKKLEERYGDSKSAAIRIAKEMAKYDEQAARKKEMDYKQQESIYTTDVRNFSKAEESKTKKYEEEAKKRQSISSKYSGAESSTSFSGVNNRFANGTLSAPGGWSVVGEVGRELMYVPPKGQIIKNNITEQILQGSKGASIGVVNVYPASFEEFIEEIDAMTFRGNVYND